MSQNIPYSTVHYYVEHFYLYDVEWFDEYSLFQTLGKSNWEISGALADLTTATAANSASLLPPNRNPY